MSFSIAGLDQLQKQLHDAQQAFRSLDGTIATLNFDPDEPASIQAAIRQMEQAVDDKTSPYRGNDMVESVASQLKEAYREEIERHAANGRLQRETASMTSEDLPSVFRQLENIVTDLRWADRSSFARHIKKLSRLLHSPELDPISRELTEGLDFEAWLEAGKATQGSMVGSAELEWPPDAREELGMVVLLIDRSAEDPDFATDFAFTFYYTGNNYVDNLQNMTTQVIVPFSRDYIDHVKMKTGVAEATVPPIRSEPAARKVFVVHGHDEGARESIARFLEKLGFEAIVLFEQAGKGQTIIEKVETYSDVGFAVVLLSPDDEGNVRGQSPPQPRARQNVILELGYFLGRLGRSRVLALKRGDLEIPSDFHGVEYQPFSSDGAWKQALGRELQAAGFDVDWNVVMR